MLSLHDKLIKLSKTDDMAIFQWTAGQAKIAKDFYLLSNLRLNTLSCNGGVIVFSTAAPLVYNVYGRPATALCDRDLLTVLGNSQRVGVNIRCNRIKPGEECAPTRYCGWRIVDEDHCPRWLENKIMSMCTGVMYPATHVSLPDIYRISKKPESLKPIFTRDLIDAIGGERDDTADVLLQKFHAKMDLFGFKTNEGFVIPSEYICSGGCNVIGAKGIPSNGGSARFSIPLRTFVAECSRNHWDIATALTIPETEEKK